MGYRLQGEKTEHLTDGNILSDGIPFGAVQVPDSGQPIIILADRQTTGGYAKIACVISADYSKIAQKMAGEWIRFEAVRIECAQQLRRDQLRRIETLASYFRQEETTCALMFANTAPCLRRRCGCSFSFENALIRAGISMRHIDCGCNVSMYKTNLQTHAVGAFRGPMVCSMRPMKPEQAKLAAEITARMPNVHGAPVHIGDPAQIGIADLGSPDYGDPVPLEPGEVPVFWPCGETPQAALKNARPELAVTHAPGYMFITDIRNDALNAFLQQNPAF